MKQKKVVLKEHGIETEYEAPGLKILHFEGLTKQGKLYFSKLSDPESFDEDGAVRP